MKKHLLMTLCSIAVVCCTAGWDTIKKTDPYFEATIKNVDIGGEMLLYQNISKPMRSCDRMLKGLGKVADEKDPTTQSLFVAFAKMLDVTSFKAIAQSSVKVEKGVYLYKQFVLTRKNTKSILAGEALKNEKLDHMIASLPADTRLALHGNFNMVYLLKRLTEEFAATGNKTLIDGLAKLRTQSKAEGVDIDAWAESACGPMMLVISGELPQDLKVAIAISDKNGVLSGLLRKQYKPKENESSYPITGIPIFPKAQLVYSEGCILLVSDPAILAKPAKMLGDDPRYSKYLPLLPKEGSGFMVVDVNPNFAALANFMIPEDKRCITIRPFRIVAVDCRRENGIASTMASNFSLPISGYKFINAMVPAMMKRAKGMAPQKKAPAATPAKAPAPAAK